MERNKILMEFLWYFLEFGWYFKWNFSGVLMEFQVKKPMSNVLLTEFDQYFGGTCYLFSHPTIPQKSIKKALR